MYLVCVGSSGCVFLKTACITLDIEPDFGQDHISSKNCVETFLLERDSRIFCSDNKLTAFVVSDILESNPELIDVFYESGVNIEFHSHSHQINRDPIVDIPRGVQVFEELVGKAPLGYRAPQGVFAENELGVLYENGIRFSSSVFPSYRPGKFNNLAKPRSPFVHESFPVIELPLGSVPVLRLPISLSYIMLFGWGFYKRLFDLVELPDNLVFMFHLHDLYRPRSFDELSSFWKSVYSRFYRGEPLSCLLEFFDYLRSDGYTFLYMDELYKKQKNLLLGDYYF